VTTSIAQKTTPSFGIFVASTGPVPFRSGRPSRFVRFKDTGGVTRGSTSVAIRTE